MAARVTPLVSLSFAGEDRAYVERVAQALAGALTKDRVFYDRFHEWSVGRPDLDLLLHEQYRDARLLVAFIGRHYASKEWCGLEWRVFRDLIKREEGARIVFVRMDDGELPGLLSLDGYHDARKFSAEEVAGFILKRLRELEGYERDRPSTLARPGVLQAILVRLNLLPEPLELRYLDLYLRRLRSSTRHEVAEKTYFPLAAKTLPQRAYGDAASLDPFITPIQQAIRLVLGQAGGGDGAGAELAASSRQSRLVRNILRVILKSEEPLVLLGDPGAGKTMTLQEVVLRLVASQIGRVFPAITVYVRLGEFHVDGPVTEQDVLAYVKRAAHPDIRGWIDELIWQRRLILLFDGMDEMSRDRYIEHTEALSRFAGSQMGRVRTVFSCRITDFSPRFIHSRLVLLPFGRSQVEQFLRRYLPGRRSIEVEGREWKLKELARYFSQGELAVDATNPFVLFLMCFFLQEQRRWPASRMELLEHYNRKNYERKAHEAALEGAELPSCEASFAEWARIAYVITERNRGQAIPIEFLVEDGAASSAERLTSTIRAGQWCGVLAESHDRSQLRFQHHRFQEFFCALHIKALSTPVAWLDKLDAPRWQETMLNLVLTGGGEDAVAALVESLRTAAERHRDAVETYQGTVNLIGNESVATEVGFERPELDDQAEAVLSDRVELAARMVQWGSRTRAELRANLMPVLRETVELLVTDGNPISQVKTLRACYRLEDLDLMKALERPLRSPIAWVRSQALLLLANTDPLARTHLSNLRTEMAFDLARGRLLTRWFAYARATYRRATAGGWWCFVLATFCACAQLTLLFAVALLPAIVVQFFTLPPFLQDPLSASGFLELVRQPRLQLALAVVTGGAAAFAIGVDGALAFWTFYSAWGAFSLAFAGTALWNGLWGISLGGLFFLAVFSSAFLCLAALAFAVPLAFHLAGTSVLRDRVAEPLQTLARVLLDPFEFFLILSAIPLVPILLHFPISGVQRLLHRDHREVASELAVLSVLGMPILAGSLLKDFATVARRMRMRLASLSAIRSMTAGELLRSVSKRLLDFFKLGLIYAAFVLVPLVIAKFAIQLGRVVVMIVAALLSAACCYWAWRMARALSLRWRSGVYAPGEFSADGWKADMQKFDALGQEHLLLRTTHRSVSLTPEEFLALLRDVRPLIQQEPALSAYWSQRDKLERSLRQERSG